MALLGRHDPRPAVWVPAVGACAAAVAAQGALPAWAGWDLAWTLGAIAAVAGMVLGRRGAPPAERSRWSWWLLAGLCWFVGQLAWDAQALFGISTTPSVADLGWWSFAVLTVVGLLRVRPGAGRTERVVAGAEVVALVAATMALTFALLWSAVAASHEATAVRLSALGYPVVYVTAAIVTLHATTGGSLRRVRGTGHRLVLAGIVLMALAFILWSPQLLRGDYVIGATIVDPLWLVALLAIAAGGLLQARRPRDEQAPAASGDGEGDVSGGVLPAAVFLGLAATLLLGVHLRASATPRIALVLGLLLCGATLILRTALAQRHLAQLLRSERAARRELAARESELAELNERLSEDARRDALTGMRNRRALTEDVVSLEAVARRQERTFAVALIDVDFFKAYNDQLGHLAGDRVLREIAAAVRGELRVGDSAYRYGGEEIVLLLRDVALAEAVSIAEKVRACVAALGIPHPSGVDGRLTISVGVAAGVKAATMLEEADAALYAAKAAGRNRVVADARGPAASGPQGAASVLSPGERQLRGVLAVSRAGASGGGSRPVLEALAAFVRGEMGYQTVVVNVRCEATDELEAVHVLGDEEVRAALAGTSSPWAQWEELLAIGEHLHGAVWISEGIEVPDRLTTWTPKHASAIGPEAWHPDDMLLLPLRDSSGAVTAILSVDEPLHGMRPDEPELRTLMAAVEHAALTLEHVAREGALTGVAARSSEARLAAVMLLAEAIDLRDAGTAQHSRMVGAYARDTAVALRLDADRVEKLHAAGVLHDLGKVGIADSILRKPGKLDAGEWEEMRRHPEVGARILERAGLEDIARWVLLHHERLDGAGYPHGLSAQEIPLEARILAVVDAYEAMTADRPYRRGMSADAAREELLRCSGSQFDPVVVEAFLASREGVVQDRSVVASH